MEIREYRVYKFNELTEDQKQLVITNLADINIYAEWHDATYEDAKNILLELDGFDIGRGNYCSGRFIEGAEDTANKIIAEHGEKRKTFQTAANYLKERAELIAKCSDDGEYTEGDEDDFDCDSDNMDGYFLQCILEDYQTILSKEYDYLTSEKAIIETIEANDYYFKENGDID